MTSQDLLYLQELRRKYNYKEPIYWAISLVISLGINVPRAAKNDLMILAKMYVQKENA